MTENLELLLQTTFTEFELATAEQIAMSLGRETPNKSDMVMAVEKAREWNSLRLTMDLPSWL